MENHRSLAVPRRVVALVVLVLLVSAPTALTEGPGALELPRSHGKGEPLPEGRREIAVRDDGELRFGGESLSPDRVKEELWKVAERNRDMAHPMQPSEVPVVIRADARATWGDVQRALLACLDPAVRIYRLYVAERVKDGSETCFFLPFAKDRGLVKTKVKLHTRPAVTVVLRPGLAPEKVVVRLLDEDLGTGEAAFAALREKAGVLRERNWKLRPELRASEGVRWADMTRVADVFRDAGYGSMYGEAFAGLQGSEVRDAFPFPTREAEEDREAAKEVRRWLRETDRDLAKRVAVLEPVLVHFPEELPRVRELLLRQEYTDSDLDEFRVKLRPLPDLMAALAEAYIEIGEQDSLLRALTLLGLLTAAEAEPPYSGPWWSWQLQTLRVYDRWAESYEDPRAAENIVTYVKLWEDLGVLDRSPVREEILALRERAAEPR